MENIESNNTEYYYEQANMLRERGVNSGRKMIQILNMCRLKIDTVS